MMAVNPTYEVRAQRTDGWWILGVPEVPGALSQVRTLSVAEEHVREAIAFVAGVPADSFEVDIVPELPEHLTREITEAKTDAEAARAAQEQASVSVRRAVASLYQAGLSGPEIARVLGVSKQRVSQLAQTG
jgi:predicted RNase H-like HicB family nuclease